MNHSAKYAPRSGWQIYRGPLLINLLALVGITSALIGNGVYDLLSWLCLGTTVGLMTKAVKQ